MVHELQCYYDCTHCTGNSLALAQTERCEFLTGGAHAATTLPLSLNL